MSELCEYCKITHGIYTRCELTHGQCICVRYCPVERNLVMNDQYKKVGGILKRKLKKEGK